jgi:hypothetical protein
MKSEEMLKGLRDLDECPHCGQLFSPPSEVADALEAKDREIEALRAERDALRDALRRRCSEVQS